MCGIVGALAQRDVTPILLEGLRRLEYRGYDSAGIAVIGEQGDLQRLRREGKVQELAKACQEHPVAGHVGIAHTRWATHGAPVQKNAHPHFAVNRVAVVHNGIIENYLPLKEEMIAAGYQFTSDTDTEVVAFLIAQQLEKHSLLEAVKLVLARLKGTYGLAIMDRQEPQKLIVTCSASPLVIGLGVEENFVASDALALLPVTSEFLFLEDGDIAELSPYEVTIYNSQGDPVQRPVRASDVEQDVASKGAYRHFMLKEIHEQKTALEKTLDGRLASEEIMPQILGEKGDDLLKQAKAIKIVACGTSFHAAMVAAYWFEKLVKIPCSAEMASEYRYRTPFVGKDSLFVTVSQSGETADTLAALNQAKAQGYLGFVSLCNVAESALARASDLVLLTRAGTEIGVASTKAFTTQLAGFLLLVLAVAKQQGLDKEQEKPLIQALHQLPKLIEQTLTLEKQIEQLAEDFENRQHSLFLGRGTLYPIAMEGALKLKEISYIHAEAYAAGELKHGPLALIDQDMPVVVVAPSNDLLEKLKSNMEEVKARGGKLYVFADKSANIESGENIRVITMPTVPTILEPIVYTLPLQLLSYYVAVIKGTDIDQPRNLAKSVTVE